MTDPGSVGIRQFPCPIHGPKRREFAHLLYGRDLSFQPTEESKAK